MNSTKLRWVSGGCFLEKIRLRRRMERRERKRNKQRGMQCVIQSKSGSPPKRSRKENQKEKERRRREEEIGRHTVQLPNSLGLAEVNVSPQSSREVSC